MKKECLFIGILLILSANLVDARLPAVNDTVIINTAAGESTRTIYGNVTDISDGFMCLKAYGFMLETPEKDGPDSIITFDSVKKDTDVCVGIGTIRNLEYIDYQKMKELI